MNSPINSNDIFKCKVTPSFMLTHLLLKQKRKWYFTRAQSMTTFTYDKKLVEQDNTAV